MSKIYAILNLAEHTAWMIVDAGGMTQAKISEVIRTRAVTQERNRTKKNYLVGHRRQRDGVQLCTTNNHHIIRNQK